MHELQGVVERQDRQLAGGVLEVASAAARDALRGSLTFQGVAHSDRHVVPETRYANKDGLHIAYQVVGEGNLDLLLVGSWYSHVEARWDIPDMAHYLRRLASFSRLISFDKQGMGLSDPIALDRLPLLEEWIDDVRARCSMRSAASGWP